jgi:hypothetical protein
MMEVANGLLFRRDKDYPLIKEIKFMSLSEKDGQVALWLFVLSALIYLLVFSGIPLSTDEMAMFTGVQSLIEQGELSATPLYWDTNGTVRFGASGYAYPNFEPVQMALATPLYWIAGFLPNVGNIHAVWLFNVFVTAATTSLLYLTSRRLNYSPGPSVALAILFALGSIALPYARTFFREPLSSFALLLAFYGMLGISNRRYTLYAAVTGFGLGLAYATKYANVVAFPVILVGVLFYLFYLPSWRARMWVLVLMVIFIAGWIGVDQSLGTLNKTGGPQAENAREVVEMVPSLALDRIDSVHIALVGYLFSPGKSIFVHTPFVLLSLVGLPRFGRRHWLAALVCLGIVTTFLLGYAYTKGDLWYGGLNWGPRFLVPVTPFILIPALPILAQLQRRPLLVKVGVGFMALLSIGVQMLAVAVPMHRYAERIGLIAPDGMWTLAIYDWRYVPIIYYWRLLNRQHVDFLWARFWQVNGQADWWPVLFVIVGIGGVGWLLWRSMSAMPISRLALLSSCLPLLVAFVLLRSSVVDPRLPGGEDRIALARSLNQQVEPTDGILLYNHTLVTFYLNVLRTSAPLYAITPQQGSLSERSVALFESLRQKHSRLWLISDDTAEIQLYPRAAARPDEAWWTARAARLAEETLSPYTRATLFINSKAAPPAAGQLHGFAQGITLQSLLREQTAEWIYLDLIWQAESALPRDYTVFIHLLDGNGQLVWQQDRQPQAGFAPTTTWRSGETIADPVAIPTGQLSSGDYRIVVGLYSFDGDGKLQHLPSSTGEISVDLTWLEIGS